MTSQEIEQQIGRFVVTSLGYRGLPENLTPDYDLIASDVLDSMAIFEIVGFIESQYDIEIPDSELVPANFQSVKAITELIAKMSVI